MSYHQLEQLSHLHDGYQKAFNINGQSLLLVQNEGKTYIIENRCPHMDVPLTDATQLPEQKIRCRAHGIEFELLTGKACGPLAGTLDCLKRFPLAYQGTSIGVEL